MKNNRREFIKKSSAFMGTGFLLSNSKKRDRSNDPIILGHNNYQYKVIPNWGILDAGKNPVNDCHELVEDAKGRIILLTNETKNNVIIYDKSGKLLETWGNSYPGAHGLTISNEGEEQFLFIADNTRHQVIKTDLKGNEILKLEYPKETGEYEHPHQFVPTETAINPINGDIYVADGYGMNFITQYDAKGNYIRHWGGRAKGGYEDEKFDTCHGVLIDTREPHKPTLLITDRVNQSLKRFTLDGKFIERYHYPGSYICRPVIHGENIIAACYRSKDRSLNASGYVQIIGKDMKAISTLGGNEPIYTNGVLNDQYKTDESGIFIHPHDVYGDSDDGIYVAQWNSNKTYPVKLERV